MIEENVDWILGRDMWIDLIMCFCFWFCSDVDATMLACIAFSCPNLKSLEILTSDSCINRITGYLIITLCNRSTYFLCICFCEICIFLCSYYYSCNLGDLSLFITCLFFHLPQLFVMMVAHFAEFTQNHSSGLTYGFYWEI